MHPTKLFAVSLAVFCLMPLAEANAIRLKVAEAHVLAGQPKDKAGIECMLTPSSKRRFFKFTKKYLDKRIAIKVDGRVIMSPVVRMPIPNGLGAMHFDLNEAAAADLAQRLNSGKAKLEAVPAQK